MFIEIKNSRGVQPIKIEKFSALVGWDIQRKFLEFAASNDRELRKKFTMEVLSYCKVVMEGRELPMITDALIDNHLETWQNIKLVFEAVLKGNGIDPETHANKSDYWTAAGQEIASAFILEATKLITPLLSKPDHGRTDQVSREHS
jgi:hypothetical protein